MPVSGNRPTPTPPPEPPVEPVVTEMPTNQPPPTDVVTQDLPTPKEEKNTEPQSYVHLADGSVLRCKDSDIPVGGGTGTPHGFWQSKNKVLQVIGVYPVETVVEENR